VQHKQETPAERLASFEAMLRHPTGAQAALDIAGFRLGMSPAEALAVCDTRGTNHTRIFAAVNPAGELLTTMPMPDPVPAGTGLLQRFASLKGSPIAGPYESTLFCTWAAGTAELSFSPPPSNVVSAVRFTSWSMPISMADYRDRLVARYGDPKQQVGPENTQRLRPTDGLVATSMKWLESASGLDCAPKIRNRTAASSEAVFTPLIPLGSPPRSKCKTHLIVRIANAANPIGEFTLRNYSAAIDAAEQFWAGLKRANPALPIPAAGWEMAIESPALACEALKHVGCRQASARACVAELEFLNRTRHEMRDRSAPSDRTLYQCLIAASTVEQAMACGVSCDATPEAQHASIGSPTATELFTPACEKMSQLGCGGSNLERCAFALQSQNNGYINADCVESATSQGDALYCGAQCGGPSGIATLLSESFRNACSNLKRVGCRVGFSDTCESDLRKLLLLLRKVRPNPHECLAKARDLFEVAKCGLPCAPPSDSETRK
jgi:hypothetical protein